MVMSTSSCPTIQHNSVAFCDQHLARAVLLDSSPVSRHDVVVQHTRTDGGSRECGVPKSWGKLLHGHHTGTTVSQGDGQRDATPRIQCGCSEFPVEVCGGVGGRLSWWRLGAEIGDGEAEGGVDEHTVPASFTWRLQHQHFGSCVEDECLTTVAALTKLSCNELSDSRCRAGFLGRWEELPIVACDVLCCLLPLVRRRRVSDGQQRRKLDARRQRIHQLGELLLLTPLVGRDVVVG
mmetsp:Transcript_48936/g.106265  ORF Transcript_48936/g.106265 Transcript_48936/m.106265 type:complete len:236 (-) Transcript_48936:133-840(-)